MEKRRIILREIEHWRRSRLLPEQYCDFLRNLYADEVAAGLERQTVFAAIRSSHWKIWGIAFSILSVLAILVIYFTSFPLPLQIAVFAFGALLCYAVGIAYRKEKKLVSYTMTGLGSLVVLLAGPCLLMLHDTTEPAYVGGYIVLCCLLWIVQGIFLRMGLFHFCGWAGLSIVYAWAMYGHFQPTDVLPAQLMWIPLSVLFVWMAWLLHRKSRQIARVLLLVGVVQWFVPDIAANFFYESTVLAQIALLIKIAAFAVLLFAFRNKWTEWVA